MKKFQIFLVVCIIFLLSSHVLAKPNSEQPIWPKGERISTLRNPKEYGYQILVRGFPHLGPLVINYSGNRIFFVQKESVYELAGGIIIYRYPGGGGGVYLNRSRDTYLASDGNLLYVFSEGLGDSLALYDLRTGQEIFDIWSPFKDYPELVIRSIAINPKNSFLYMETYSGLSIFNPKTQKLKIVAPESYDLYAFDPQGNWYKGSLENGFSINHGKPVKVELRGANFPGARENESLDFYFSPMQYDHFTHRLLIGGRIFNEGTPEGYTVFEVDPKTGKTFSVIEQRGDIELNGMATDAKGNIFLSVGDNCADCDDMANPLIGQIIKLERR